MDSQTVYQSAIKAVRRETLTSACTNILFNAACAVLFQLGNRVVVTDFWNVFIDTFITCNCTCIITTLTGSLKVKHLTAEGIYGAVQVDSWRNDLPRVPLLLAFSLSGMSAFALAPTLGFLFMALGVTQLPLWVYIIYKACWGGALGCFVAYTVQSRCAFGPKRLVRAGA